MSPDSRPHTSPVTTPHLDDPRLQLLERQLHRYAGDGDCAYERALNALYQKLFEQRLSQLTALRNSGL